MSRVIQIGLFIFLLSLLVGCQRGSVVKESWFFLMETQSFRRYQAGNVSIMLPYGDWQFEKSGKLNYKAFRIARQRVGKIPDWSYEEVTQEFSFEISRSPIVCSCMYSHQQTRQTANGTFNYYAFARGAMIQYGSAKAQLDNGWHMDSHNLFIEGIADSIMIAVFESIQIE